MMKKLTSTQRQQQILELLSDGSAAKTADLAEHFQVSRETIRLDLLELTGQGLVQKWFGGVIRSNPSSSVSTDTQDDSFPAVHERMNRMPDAKMQICRKALELIPEHATIFIDTGSTTLYFARMLRALSGYTIISTSLQIINTLCGSSNKLIICGGVIDTDIMSASGAPTVEFLQQLRTDVAVFGSSGFKANSGPTGLAFDYSHIKKTALKNTLTSIVLADSSKAGYSSPLQFADWSEIDYLVTDPGMDAASMKAIGIHTKIILAPRPL